MIRLSIVSEKLSKVGLQTTRYVNDNKNLKNVRYKVHIKEKTAENAL